MNPFPKTLEPGQRVEYIVTGLDQETAEQHRVDPTKLFTKSTGGHDQVQLGLVVEADEGPVTRRHWITFNEKYPDIAKNQLKALGWDGTNVSQLRGVGTKQCKLVGTPQKNDPSRINWNLYPMSRPVTDEQRLPKDRLAKLDDLYSETKIAAAAPVRTAAPVARKF